MHGKAERAEEVLHDLQKFGPLFALLQGQNKSKALI